MELSWAMGSESNMNCDCSYLDDHCRDGLVYAEVCPRSAARQGVHRWATAMMVQVIENPPNRKGTLFSNYIPFGILFCKFPHDFQ